MGLAQPAASRLGCAAELAKGERLCERGDGTTEQRHVYKEKGNVRDVVQWLSAQTVARL